jgi:hypothetical protein
MQVTGMLYGATMLQFIGFPTSEVLGPSASEEEIRALIDHRGRASQSGSPCRPRPDPRVRESVLRRYPRRARRAGNTGPERLHKACVAVYVVVDARLGEGPRSII